ncbi:MAG: hypothetical protein EP348_00795 [Alphaproteobacteria bacterium]|nr:MAG: hypothetical protein EP348_00795 [Alphaproteobacteria bacterium]
MSVSKAIPAVVVALVLSAGFADATPVSVEGAAPASFSASDQEPTTLAVVSPAGPYGSATQLYHDKAVQDEVAEDSGFFSKVPLPPAVLLFGAALGAIGWLGHRRKPDQSIRD